MNLFPHLIGQSQLKNRIEALMCEGTSRAFLLVGPRGVGKKTFGRAMAQVLLCSNPDSGGFCGTCSNCNYFEAHTHPDYIELMVQEGDKNIRVSAVRQKIISDLWLYPQISAKKVYLIQADELNEEGQNALLKTLEEPPNFAHFILLVSDSESLQKTVLSRMTVLTVPLMQNDEISTMLANRLHLDKEDLHDVAINAQGNPGQALLIAEDEIYDELKHIVQDIFFSIQGASKADILIDFYQTLEAYKKEIEIVLIFFQRMLGELLRFHLLSGQSNQEDFINSNSLKNMMKINSQMSVKHIQRASESVTLALRAIRGNCGFEVTVCRMLLELKKELSNA